MDGLFEALKSNPHLSHAEALRSSMLQMIDTRPSQNGLSHGFGPRLSLLVSP